jgi:Na+-driven multidrug efflux pump
MIQQRAFNTLPNKYYAMAQGTASKIDNIFGMALNGCGLAMTTFAGQNFGAKNYNRLREGLKAGMLVGLIYTAFSTTGSILLAQPLTRFLLPSAPEEVYLYAQQYLTFQGVFYYLLLLLFIFRQALQAMGKSSLTIFGGITELVLRVIVSFTFAVWFGFEGACISNPLAWLGGALCFIILCIATVRKFPKEDFNIKVDGNEPLKIGE